MQGIETDGEAIVIARNALGLPIGLPGARRVSAAKTKHHAVEVLATPHLGRVILVDGHVFQAELGEVRRAESLMHPLMVLGPILPESILFLGMPTAPMVAELLRYEGVAKIVIAEPDEELPGICKAEMPRGEMDPLADSRVSVERGPVAETVQRMIGAGQKFDAVAWNLLGHLTRGAHIENRAAIMPVLPKLASTAGRAMGLLGEEFRVPPRKALIDEIKAVCMVFDQALLMNVAIPECQQESAVWLAGYSLRRPTEITEYSLDSILGALGGDPLKWVTAEWIKAQFAIPAAMITALDRALGQLSPGHWGSPHN